MTTPAFDREQPRQILARLLTTPNLAVIVPQLEPQVLHRLVRACGLDDCGAIVALATPDQLQRVFDLDVWRGDAPGTEDRFDPERFGVWLEVLVDGGVAMAAEKLTRLEFDFVTAAISQSVIVVDRAFAHCVVEKGHFAEIGGYRVVQRHHDSWDALLAVLAELEDTHHSYFCALMARCRQIYSEEIDDGGGSYDVLNPDAQIMSDVGGDREERREQEGYVTPPMAAAFLEASTRFSLRQTQIPPRDFVTSTYFRNLARRPATAGEGTVLVIDALRRAGVVPEAPRALLDGETTSDHPRFTLIREHMRLVGEHDGAAFARRHEELGYLANLLMAGCAVDAGSFDEAGAYRAAVAVCNLGLENWPAQWRSRTPDFLVKQELVSVFQVGWATLYQNVGAYVLRRLDALLSTMTFHDSDLEDDIETLRYWLRHDLDAGTPWRVRDRLDVLAILDMPAWSILLRLIDQCPCVPADIGEPQTARRALRMTSDFAVISENRQIAWVHDFVETLPERLAG